MTYKIKKMINNGTEYKIGSIDSSNDTYADIVHLTQEQYDALENPDPDTLYSTPDSTSPGTFTPENAGETGQVLTKSQTGYRWNDIDVNEVPDGGDEGQVLTKTANGYDWAAPVVGGLGLEFVEKKTFTHINGTTTKTIGTYNYPTIIFAYSTSGRTDLILGTTVNNNFFPSPNYDQFYCGGAWQFFAPGVTAQFMVYQGSASYGDYVLYVYKFAFPE